MAVGKLLLEDSMEKNYSPLPVKGTVKRQELAAYLWKHRHEGANKWELYDEWRDLRDQKASALRTIRTVEKALA